MPQDEKPQHRLFITGTDTDAGKTHITHFLLSALAQQGMRTVGYKPIASGAARGVSGHLENTDVLSLQQASSVKRPYTDINAYTFAPAIAPHLAAKQSQTQIDTHKLNTQLQHLSTQADYVIIEGAGGWQLPLCDNRYLSDWVVENRLPVILVVGGKLGCLNHALLTLSKIQNDGGRCIGWIWNTHDPNMAYLHENQDTLRTHLPVPCLSVFSHNKTPVPEYFDWQSLFSAISSTEAH